MTSLSQTALEFARECLGWRDAAGTHDIKTVFEHLRDEPSASFHFTDLNAVMAAVQRWCDKSDGSLELSYYGYIPAEWEARIGTPSSVETIEHADPCHALLAACVEAARKPKTT